MSQDPLRLVILTASLQPGRLGPIVTGWFADRARRRTDLSVDVIDASAELPPVERSTAARTAVGRRLAAADAFVVVTPEYNHSFPGPLKHLIDQYTAEWRAKPVGFVSYGGISGGLRAVEQLRLVFAELHAATIRNTVSFHRARERFDGDGNPKDPDSETAATALLEQLSWWAHALRDARTARPYVA